MAGVLCVFGLILRWERETNRRRAVPCLDAGRSETARPFGRNIARIWTTDRPPPAPKDPLERLTVAFFCVTFEEHWTSSLSIVYI